MADINYGRLQLGLKPDSDLTVATQAELLSTADDFRNWTLENQLPQISRRSQILKLSLTMTVTYTLILFVLSVSKSKTINFVLKQFYFLNNWQVARMTIIESNQYRMKNAYCHFDDARNRILAFHERFNLTFSSDFT